jgi:site-specific recombinase XerD
MMHDHKHLVSAQVEKLIAATKGTRHDTRDRCLLLLMFQHGLRVSEACGLVLSQVDTERRVLHVKRLKDRLPRRTRYAVTSFGRSRHGGSTVPG